MVLKIVIFAAVSESQFPSDSVTFSALYVSLFKAVKSWRHINVSFVVFFFFADVLGSTAFAPVKLDISGNIKVSSWKLLLSCFLTA